MSHIQANNLSIENLISIRNNGGSYILLEYPGKIANIPRLWVYFNNDLSSFILVNREYLGDSHGNKHRSFNHIIIDDTVLEIDNPVSVFDQAITQIQDHKCYEWDTYRNTFKTLNCKLTHM